MIANWDSRENVVSSHMQMLIMNVDQILDEKYFISFGFEIIIYRVKCIIIWEDPTNKQQRLRMGLSKLDNRYNPCYFIIKQTFSIYFNFLARYPYENLFVCCHHHIGDFPPSAVLLFLIVSKPFTVPPACLHGLNVPYLAFRIFPTTNWYDKVSNDKFSTSILLCKELIQKISDFKIQLQWMLMDPILFVVKISLKGSNNICIVSYTHTRPRTFSLCWTIPNRVSYSIV